MKAMGSLQDDRDRVLNTYKQLEEKHLQVLYKKTSFFIHSHMLYLFWYLL